MASRSADNIEVYLEVGKKRTFAGAIDWPGWIRIGRDEASALQALFDYGPRYARAIQSARLGFQPAASVSAFTIVERIEGNGTTDFGAPDMPSARDAMPFDETARKRYQALLRSCWQAFDAAAKEAAGHELRKGPRGGGRDLEGIIRHVIGADGAYLSRLGLKVKLEKENDLDNELKQTRETIIAALASATRGEIPSKGPRGGKIWSPHYFVRRVAWHVLDHAWEIEDRLLP